MSLLINHNPVEINCDIALPASKSIYNRLRIISALAEQGFAISGHGALPNDVLQMQNALVSSDPVKDIGPAGTAMRFLTAYFSLQPGRRVLTGTARMKQRPIKVLVDALRQLGAGIRYLETDGCPPIEITGKQMKGGAIAIDGSVSSQYITALLLIAPQLHGGLELRLTGRVISRSYIRMSLALMQRHGARCRMDGNTIHVDEGSYHGTNASVEADWSAASYWFAIAALAPKADIRLKGLEENSIQGDAQVRGYFARLGVESRFVNNKLCIRNKGLVLPDHFEQDFTDTPDLAQTMAVVLAMLGVPFRLSGLESLRIKETDRIAALKAELSKLGVHTDDSTEGELRWDGRRTSPMKQISIATYHDHRMAMAFAPAALKTGPVRIEDEEVVNKSYPTYWDDLKKAGFVLG